MAFDGPGPFDGDPVYDYLHEIEGASPAKARAALKRAFDEVIERNGYVDVDETVWAWAAAELVALALGHPSNPPPPDPFASAVRRLPDPHGLVALALSALDVVADEERSEVAGLWADSGGDRLAEHLMPLRTRLQRGPTKR